MSEDEKQAAVPPVNENPKDENKVKCPGCGAEISKQYTFCTSCGTRLSQTNEFSRTQTAASTMEWDFKKIKRLKLYCMICWFGIFSTLILWNAVDFLCGAVNQDQTDQIQGLLSTQTVLSWLNLLSCFALMVLFFMLWRAINKSVASTIIHGLFLFILNRGMVAGPLIGGIILGSLMFWSVVMDQTEKVLKNEGRVKVTFFGIKPLMK